MSYLANQLSSKEEKSRLTEIFKSFDKNNDGVLSRDELINGYTQLYGSVERATLEVEAILNNVDVNRNGTIDYSGMEENNILVIFIYRIFICYYADQWIANKW